jgi:regulator of RNase E activity RraA
LIKRYRRLSTPTISDSLERAFGILGVFPIGNCLSSLKGKSMAGPALTVRTRPGDNLVVHKALDLARPGDILVIDAGGELTNAILGELMSLYAASCGIAGLVVDGAVRDKATISNGLIPVFARGVSHRGPYKSGPGEIHGTVSLGGVPVHDGDIIVGDDDGIVVVPRARAEVTAAAAEEVVAREEEQRKAIERGEWDRSWIDEALRTVEV